MKKIVALYDIHVPFNIDLNPVFEFVQDFKPDVVILGGDIHDWTSVCHWISDQSRALDGGTVFENYQELREVVLNPLKRASPHSKKIYITGNHEDWLRKAGEMQPNGRQYWGLEDNLKDVGIKIVPINIAYEANKNLVYIHGVYVNEFHAKKTVLAYHTSVIYSHTHDVQSYTMVSPVNITHFYKASSVGCLCNLNPHYNQNRPNKWVNGFNFCYVNDDGSFHDTQVIIVKNKFWANGRFYK